MKLIWTKGTWVWNFGVENENGLVIPPFAQIVYISEKKHYSVTSTQGDGCEYFSLLAEAKAYANEIRMNKNRHIDGPMIYEWNEINNSTIHGEVVGEVGFEIVKEWEYLGKETCSGCGRTAYEYVAERNVTKIIGDIPNPIKKKIKGNRIATCYRCGCNSGFPPPNFGILLGVEVAHDAS